MAPRYLSRTAARQVDQTAIHELGFPGCVLMENAGRGCVDVLRELGVAGAVLVLCGKGNNAGDGFVIARHLSLQGVRCRVALVSDPSELEGDARTAYRMMTACDVSVRVLGPAVEHELDRLVEGCDWIVDALLGTGASGDPRPPYDRVIRWANEQPFRRLAVDLPSGLDCDTGMPGSPTLAADHTCTFVAEKSGFREGYAHQHLGQVHVVGIGVPLERADRPPLVVPTPALPPGVDWVYLRLSPWLRGRPLVWPLLLATLMIDLVAWFLCVGGGGRNRDIIYFGLLMPQLGLLSVWAAARGERRGTRVAIAAGFLAWQVLVHATARQSDVVTIALMLFAYAVVTGGVVFLASVFGLDRMAHRDATKDHPIRYSTWQLLVLMTVVAVAAALAKQLGWLFGGNIPVFAGLIAVVLLAHYGAPIQPRPWPGWGLTLLPGVALGVVFDNAELMRIFLTTALVAGVWTAAVNHQPDPKQALAN